MSCSNVVRVAKQTRRGLVHARNIAHEAARSQSTAGDIPGPSERSTRRHKPRNASHSRFDPNKMTSTSVAHYYKSSAYRHWAHTSVITDPIRPASGMEAIPRGRRSVEAVSSQSSPAGPRVTAASRISSSDSWEQTREKRREREETLKRFTLLIRSHYGNTYDARPFGSTCYGASSSTSDIDVVIIDADRPYGIKPGDTTPLPPIYDVRRLARLLKAEGYKNVFSIPHAAVPLVKFMDPITGMSCDANVNNRLGVYNTALLRQYCLREPNLARYLRTIKLWVKSVDLNNPSVERKPRSFSSYAITLMTVAFLQSTGHLPNLQADEDVILQTHFWEFRMGKRRSVSIRFGACKDWERPSWLRPPTFQAWLRFWAHEFDFEKRVISVRDGGFIERPERVPREWGHVEDDSRDTGNIVVLDPLSDRNCTYPITSATLSRFKRECATALQSWREAGRREISSLDITEDFVHI